MANEVFQEGDVFVTSIYDTTATAYQPIGCSESDTLSETLEIDSFQTKCEAGVIKKDPGASDYEITGEGRFIDENVDTGRQSYAKLSGYLRNKTRILWRQSTGVAATPFEYGYGYVSACEKTGESGTKITYSYTISGDSAIVTTDPEV